MVKADSLIRRQSALVSLVEQAVQYFGIVYGFDKNPFCARKRADGIQRAGRRNAVSVAEILAVKPCNLARAERGPNTETLLETGKNFICDAAERRYVISNADQKNCYAVRQLQAEQQPGLCRAGGSADKNMP